MYRRPGTPAPAAPSRREVAWWVALAFLWAASYAARFLVFVPSDWEVSADGNLARGILEGLAASPFFYQHAPWGHGPLVIGLLLTPFHALFGSSMLWIQLIGAVFAAGGVLAWVTLVRRVWGPWEAFWLAVWFVVPPPVIGALTHRTWGNHMESILLSGLLVALFVRERTAAPSPARGVAIGLLAGFASFFCLHNLAPAAAVFAAFAWRWGRPGVARLLWPTVPAFVLGFAPHWLYQAATSSPVSMIAYRPHPLARWWELLVVGVPHAGRYLSAWAVVWATVLFGLGVAAAVGRWVRVGRPTSDPGDQGAWLGRVLLLWMAAYVAAYGLASFHIDLRTDPTTDRYTLTLVPAAMALAVHLLARLPRRVGPLLLAPLLVAGALDGGATRTGRDFVKMWREGTLLSDLTALRGDDFLYFAERGLALSWGTPGPIEEPAAPIDVPRAVRSLKRLSPPWRPIAAEALGLRLGYPGAMARVERDDEALRPWRRELAFGAGRAAVVESIYIPSTDRLSGLPDRLAALEPDRARAVAEGMGCAFMAVYDGEGRLDPPSALRLRRGERGGRGLNGAWYDATRVEQVREINRRLLAILPETLRPALAYGAARQIGQAMGAGDYRAATLAVLDLPGTDAERAAFDGGLAQGVATYLLAHYVHFAWPAAVDRERLRAALEQRGAILSDSGDPRYPVAIATKPWHAERTSR